MWHASLLNSKKWKMDSLCHCWHENQAHSGWLMQRYRSKDFLTRLWKHGLLIWHSQIFDVHRPTGRALYPPSGQWTTHNVGMRSDERDTHIWAGARLMTSMTYAPEVTSGKSDCLSFSSLASLSGGRRKEKQPNHEVLYWISTTHWPDFNSTWRDDALWLILKCYIHLWERLRFKQGSKL